jgi:hypothetical protein
VGKLRKLKVLNNITKKNDMRKIYDFKKGDEIVRIAPSKMIKTSNIFGGLKELSGDRSYMGEKLIFIGIANGQIYLKPTGKFYETVFGKDYLIDLDIDLWGDGWDYYIDPKTLFDKSEIIVDKATIEKEIKIAIENEDYELAAKLKTKL